MKMHFLVLMLAVAAVSCSPSNQITSSVSSGNSYYAQFLDLASVLKQQPLVSVTGSGQYAKVAVRRFAQTGHHDPLYVLNGTPIGQNYSRANEVVNLNEVASIRVLHSPSQLIAYGPRGAHGAIVITTKDLKETVAANDKRKGNVQIQ